MSHPITRRRITRRRATALIACSFALAASHSLLQASDKPPLRLILPVSAGSGVDAIVRAAAPSLSRALDGQSVVIENLPGAGGITGTTAIVKAPPDGQTIGIVSNNHAVNPSVFTKKLPYDSLADITPISVVGATPFVLVVNPSKVKATNAKELQAMLQGKPGVYNYASSGNGTIIHLAGEMVIGAMGAQVRHIPYKGTGAMVAALLGGQIEMGVVAVPAVQGQLKSGALRAIGVTGPQRVPALPDVPTIAEQGFPEVDVAGWFAMVGPAGMPPAEVKRLHDAVVAAFDMPEARDAMAKQGNVINPTTPQAAAQFFRSEQERYAKLVKKADIRLD